MGWVKINSDVAIRTGKGTSLGGVARDSGGLYVGVSCEYTRQLLWLMWVRQ